MRIGCFQACACVSYCSETAKQALAVTIIKLNEIKHSPEASQKAFVIALCIIRGINFHYHTNYLPHLVSVLDTAPAFDFYGFCRLPRLFLHPYHAESLDEYDLLDQLEDLLCSSWHLGIRDDQGKNRDPLVRQFAQEQLTAFLKKIIEKDLDFSTEEEVKTILHNWFEKTLEANPEDDFDPYSINLQDLKIKLKTVSWVETIITYTFISVDIACVPDFLQQWEVINLTPYSNYIGNFPLLSWVPNQELGDWIWSAMGVGFLLQFLDAAHSLWKGDLTPGEASDAEWVMVASAAECLHCVANIQKRNDALINCLALIAKSLGLIAFFAVSEPTFFNDG